MGKTSERRKPNTGLDEADYLQIMEEFRAGATDAELGARWNISPATVSSQRAKRQVYRRDQKGPRPAPGPLVLRAGCGGGGLDGSAAAEGQPALVMPEGDDPVRTADALLAHARKLTAMGRFEDAITVTRLSRSQFLTLMTRQKVLLGGGWAALDEVDEDGDVAPSPARPVLRTAQTAPEGDWRTWLFLGGRGAGKTLAGAAWLAGRARSAGRLALVGPTLGDVREVMIEGPSGLRGAAAAFGPAGGRPAYEASRRRLVWPNGAVAAVFSAEDPESLRGPQFAAAWADELCAWAKPEETLAMLRMGLRLGDDPRLVLTTTPKPLPGLRAVLAEAGLVVTRGSALENAAHLAPGFVEGLRVLYAGTRWERQEIDGEVLEALEGAVFRAQDLAAARALGAAARPEAFDRLVVAVDPPAGRDGAACGIVVAGRVGREAWVLEDATAQGLSPGGWAARVAEAAARAGRLGPVSVVAEANQGGEMVRQVLTGGGVTAPLRLVHAVLDKRTRAEPVALLYEQGRVAHAAGLGALEDQLLLLGAGPVRGGASPDRADALVWALTTLLLTPERGPPSVGVL